MTIGKFTKYIYIMIIMMTKTIRITIHKPNHHSPNPNP